MRNLLVLLVVASACASPAPSGHADTRPLEFGLVGVSGEPIPVALATGDECSNFLTMGSLRLARDSTFQLRTGTQLSCAGYGEATSVTYRGVFSHSEGRLELHAHSHDTTLHGRLESGVVELELHGSVLEFVAGAPGEVDLLAWQADRIVSELGSRPSADAYRCQDDPVLFSAPLTALRDTAGLGARITQAFPGYRLSTERELACRFPLMDGTSPHMFQPELGTGRAWWVQSADVNGDGRPDIVTVLSREDDPSKDLLVVLFADGSAAPVSPLGGWGFGVDPAETGAWIYVVFWEKGSDRYRWTGAEFEMDLDRCC
jgi:hypothetical protein